jgi:metacaspase-1
MSKPGYMVKVSRAVAALLMGLSCSAASLAASHALIMTIDDYDNAAFKVPENAPASQSPDLPGVAKDAASFRRIAELMGVPASNIRELRNAQLSAAGIRAAMQETIAKIQSGDKVLIFYAGHGSQRTGQGGNRCTEGMLTYDAQLYPDTALRQDLQQLAARAGQVIMFNDSCFSGGASTARTGATRSVGGEEFLARGYPYPEAFRPTSADQAGYQCGVAINSARSASVASANASGGRLLYVATAAETEVAWESRGGGMGTVAILECLTNPAADTDRSGSISGEELQVCAQARMAPNFERDPMRRQRITLVGDSRLSLVSLAAAQPGGNTPVNPTTALQDLVAPADPTHTVTLTAQNTTLKMGRDFLNLTVRSARAGYLYLLHVGPDNQKVHVLYPNQFDRDNRIEAGQDVVLPRAGWGIKATGPAGQHRIVAIVSDKPRDFSAARMSTQGGFAETDVSAQSFFRLSVVATADRFGASQLVTVTETP